MFCGKTASQISMLLSNVDMTQLCGEVLDPSVRVFSSARIKDMSVVSSKPTIGSFLSHHVLHKSTVPSEPFHRTCGLQQSMTRRGLLASSTVFPCRPSIGCRPWARYGLTPWGLRNCLVAGTRHGRMGASSLRF
ncbi:unnamed protein product [Musa acuminata var. zebrina]